MSTKLQRGHKDESVQETWLQRGVVFDQRMVGMTHEQLIIVDSSVEAMSVKYSLKNLVAEGMRG